MGQRALVLDEVAESGPEDPLAVEKARAVLLTAMASTATKGTSRSRISRCVQEVVARPK